MARSGPDVFPAPSFEIRADVLEVTVPPRCICNKRNTCNNSKNPIECRSVPPENRSETIRHESKCVEGPGPKRLESKTKQYQTKPERDIPMAAKKKAPAKKAAAKKAPAKKKAVAKKAPAKRKAAAKKAPAKRKAAAKKK